MSNKPEQNFNRYRTLTGIPRVIQASLFIGTVLLGLSFILNVHTYLGLSLYSEQWIGVFISLFLVSTFLSLPLNKRVANDSLPWYDIVLCVLSLPAGIWIAINYPKLVLTLGEVTAERTILALLTILLILEAGRRLIGKILVIIPIVFILYGAYSSYLPGSWSGLPISWGKLLTYLYLDPNSMLNLLGMAATIGLAFIFFGQILLKYGGGDALTNIALLFFGRTRGGPAKAAVVGSSLVGTVGGAPVSNVFLSGSVTIPLMIKNGYSRRFAGAVESVASSGGQIMPPVMGIAAFMIAERLGIPYANVALAALIPAILFYVAVFVQVDLEAGRHGLRKVQKEDMPKVKQTLKDAWPVAIVIAVLIYTIFIIRLNPATAGVLSGLIAIPIFALKKENRVSFFTRLKEAVEGTGRLILDVTSALAVAGLVMGVISVSGLGFTFGYLLVQIGNQSLILLLLSAAVGSIILGMGMPSVAAYALVATLVAPALVDFGIIPIAAHLFIFYFAIVSNFTPPIALAAFAAAAIAETSPMKTALTATRLGMLAYIIPFIFVYDPSLIMQSTLGDTLLSFATAVLGTIIIGAGLTGFLFKKINWGTRIGTFIAGVLMLYPLKGADYTAIINVIGFALAFIIIVLSLTRRSKQSATNIEAEKV
ncbi:TRAP transporter fused permease subunit [Robertmurraya massiliosenegalensis]|uniref:TRAP transporter permease n=1 Tax=Robertmurraya TaxID=2837507 RepID=UPI0039A41EC9